MNRRSIWLAAVAVPLFALAIVGTAGAEQTSNPETCPSPIDASAPAEAGSLKALRPTLLMVAEEHDKQAKESAEQAERYRTWASAEEMFGGTTYGKRYAAIYFADEADRLDAEAAENRALAAKYRQLANSKDATKGC